MGGGFTRRLCEDVMKITSEGGVALGDAKRGARRRRAPSVAAETLTLAPSHV